MCALPISDAGLRPERPPGRLWRGLLRSHARRGARPACGAGDRHRLCGTGGRGGPGGAGGRSAGRRGDRTRLSRLYGVGALRLLFLGDVVGRAGRAVVTERLPGLIRDLATDFVVCNGENAAGGFGITAKSFAELYEAGVDVITPGHPVRDQREIRDYITADPRPLRPRNFPARPPRPEERR